MFQITKVEKEELVAICDHLQTLKFSPNLPYVFTEQGISMLSAVLHSKKAIEVSIQIINAFVEMKTFIFQNQDIFKRLNIVETKLLQYDNNFNNIFKLLENQTPKKGIFFEGELFDAHIFISDLVRQAKREIKLIDNYIDERTLNLFKKKGNGIKVIIYTKNITKEIKEDVKKFNKQYKNLEIKEFKLSHDRFLLIDEIVYHLGASLKDLGNKWFAFSKMEELSENIIKKLKI